MKDLGTLNKNLHTLLHVSTAMGGTGTQEVDHATSLKKECTFSVMVSANDTNTINATEKRKDGPQTIKTNAGQKKTGSTP